jgi:hypothetical protein
VLDLLSATNTTGLGSGRRKTLSVSPPGGCVDVSTGNMRLITGRMFVDFMFPRIRAGLQDGSLACDFPFLILHAEHDHIPISGAPHLTQPIALRRCDDFVSSYKVLPCAVGELPRHVRMAPFGGCVRDKTVSPTLPLLQTDEEMRCRSWRGLTTRSRLLV